MTPRNDDYKGPVRLIGKPGARIPWGQRDRATAFAVIQNMQQVTPPLVIPWRPGMEKIKRCLAHSGVADSYLGELQTLVDNSTRHRELVDGGETYRRVAAAFRAPYRSVFFPHKYSDIAPPKAGDDQS